MYTFLFNNDYLLNKNNEAAAVQQQSQASVSDANAQTKTITVPMNGANTVTNPSVKLTDAGNVPMAQASADATKGIDVENKNAKYIDVNLNALPKKNVFYNALESYHKGFKKASTEEKSKIFADYLKQVSPEKREALIEKLHEGGQFKEVDEIMIKGNKELGENAVLTNHVALTKTRNGAIKKVTDGMVADHYTEAQAPYQTTILGDIYKYAGKEAKIKAAGHASDVDEKYQVAAHKLTACQGDEDVAAAGAKVSWKTAKEHQVEIAKIYKALNNEKVEKTLATVEGKFDKENQQPIYKMLMSSKYKSVLKTAANYIYTMDKENQSAAVKMTANTHCKEAIDAARSHYNDYDASCRDDINNTLSHATYSVAKEENNNSAVNEAVTNLPSDTKSSSDKSVVSSDSTIVEKFNSIDKSNSAVREIEYQTLLNNANPTEQLTLLQSLPAEDAISLAKLISNPSLDIINLITEKAGDLSAREQNMLASSIGRQYSDRTISTFFPKCGEDLQLAYISNCPDTTIFSLVNKNTLSDKAQKALKERNIFSAQ